MISALLAVAALVPSEEFAAEEYAHWTRELTGAAQPIRFVRLAADDAAVRGDGFRLENGPDGLCVAAKGAGGWLSGVYYALTRYGGIRWFTPDSGVDLPDGKKSLEFPQRPVVRNPPRYRAGLTPSSGKAATPEVNRAVGLWQWRNGFEISPRPPVKASYVKLAEVVAGASAGRKYIEEFRTWKASKCPNAPAVWSLFAIDVPSSEAWWDFVNPLAREALEDPLVRVRVAVLRQCQTVPTGAGHAPLKSDRLSVLFYTHGRCHLHALTDGDCPHNPKIAKRLLDWKATGLEVNAFEFMNQLAGKVNYSFWERAWVGDLKWYARQDIASAEGGLVGPWAGMVRQDTYARNNAAKARWLTAYLTGWFSWDAEDDFEAVRNEALRRYYRSAAEPMMRYHELLERALLDSGACLTYGGGTAFVAASQVPGVLEKGSALLADAKRLASGDAETLRRVARDAEYFKVEWLEAVPEPSADELRTLPASLQFGDGAVDVRRDGGELVVSCRLPKPAGGFKDVVDDGSTFAAMEGPHVEFLLFAPTMKGKYWHFAVAHNGLVYSALTENGSSRDLAKKLDFTRRISETETDWSVDCRIPFAAFGGSPAYIRIDAVDGTRTLSGKGFHGPLTAVPLSLEDV